MQCISDFNCYACNVWKIHLDRHHYRQLHVATESHLFTPAVHHDQDKTNHMPPLFNRVVRSFHGFYPAICFSDM